MLDIAVCDDNRNFARYLSNVLYGFEEDFGITLEVETFPDGRLLLERIQQGKRFDLIYLDILMKDMDGLRTAKEIRKLEGVGHGIGLLSMEKMAMKLGGTLTIDEKEGVFSLEIWIPCG